MGATPRSVVGQLGAAQRFHPERVEDLRRDLAIAKLEAYVAKVVAEAPPLTPEQRDRLALILSGGAA